MAEANKKDMGTGSVKRWMVTLAVPALVGQFVNLLYNIVDRIYIGHLPEIGADALTGVGLFTPILMLITAFALLSGAGGAPEGKAMAVFLAEPISDFIAAAVTATTFFIFFRKLLKGGKKA